MEDVKITINVSPKLYDRLEECLGLVNKHLGRTEHNGVPLTTLCIDLLDDVVDVWIDDYKKGRVG